ncbi:hypothetical protein XENOCAPTIV_000953 [Xenoophorus captivus]|uniref:Uncharacterized protein n=1 Tax=Xenoophorus captivus TaxID=1517983 RepID=A0ABV0R623_9TELE
MIMFSQLICLSIKGYSIRLHVDAAGLAAGHPANRGTIEGGTAADVVLVHHCGFRLLFGHLSIWQLEFHELVGLFEAAVGYGHPSQTRAPVLQQGKLLQHDLFGSPDLCSQIKL